MMMRSNIKRIGVIEIGRGRCFVESFRSERENRDLLSLSVDERSVSIGEVPHQKSGEER